MTISQFLTLRYLLQDSDPSALIDALSWIEREMNRRRTNPDPLRRPHCPDGGWRLNIHLTMIAALSPEDLEDTRTAITALLNGGRV